MVRRFRVNSFLDDVSLERWLNAMADRPEEIRENSPWRHHASRQIKIESISVCRCDSSLITLAVISRLEDDDES